MTGGNGPFAFPRPTLPKTKSIVRFPPWIFYALPRSSLERVGTALPVSTCIDRGIQNNWLVYLTWNSLMSCKVRRPCRHLLTRRCQHDTDVYLSKRCKKQPKLPTSNRTIKHMTHVLDDRVGLSNCNISTMCRVEPPANRLDDWRIKQPWASPMRSVAGSWWSHPPIRLRIGA